MHVSIQSLDASALAAPQQLSHSLHFHSARHLLTARQGWLLAGWLAGWLAAPAEPMVPVLALTLSKRRGGLN